MQKLFDMFKSHSDIFLTLEHKFNPLQSPKGLISELTNSPHASYMADFLKKVEKLSQRSAMQRMRILTVLSLLILHSDQFYEVVLLMVPFKGQEKKKQQNQDNDQWIDANFVQPCEQFIVKCCSTSERYRGLKSWQKGVSKQPYLLNNFQTLFYLVNLMKKGLECLQKISSLGRYYQQENPNLTKMFIFTMLMQIIRLYASLKLVLQAILSSPKQHLELSSNREMMKNLLLEHLPEINECMKMVILNKYFNPYENGIRVMLFTNENQCEDTTVIINGLIKQKSVLSSDRKRYNIAVLEMKENYSFCRESLFSDMETGCKSLMEKRTNSSIESHLQSPLHKKQKIVSQQVISGKNNTQNRKKAVPTRGMKDLKMLRLKKMSTLEQMSEGAETDQESREAQNNHSFLKKKGQVDTGNCEDAKEFVCSSLGEPNEHIFNTEKSPQELEDEPEYEFKCTEVKGQSLYQY